MAVGSPLELARAYVMVGMNTARFKADFQNVRKETEVQIDTMVSSVSSMLGRVGAIMGTGALTTAGLSMAGRMEKEAVSLLNVLGSMERAKDIILDVGKFAANSSFGFEEMALAARRLLMAGESTADLIPTLEMLGNAAAGAGVSLEGVVRSYEKVRVRGNITMRELITFTSSGVITVNDLARAMGKSADEVVVSIAKGEVTFSVLQKVFKELSSEGGKYFNLMSRQSGTLTGTFETLRATFQLFLGVLMEGFGPALKSLMNLLIESLRFLMSVFGNKSVQRIVVFVGTLFTVVQAFKVMNAVLKATASMFAITKALAGPAGWVQLAVGIATASAAVAALNSSFSEVENSVAGVQSYSVHFDEMSDSIKEATDSAEGLGVVLKETFAKGLSATIDWKEEIKKLGESVLNVGEKFLALSARLESFFKGLSSRKFLEEQRVPMEKKITDLVMQRGDLIRRFRERTGYALPKSFSSMSYEELQKIEEFAKEQGKEVYDIYMEWYAVNNQIEEARKKLAEMEQSASGLDSETKQLVENWDRLFPSEEEKLRAVQVLTESMGLLGKKTPVEEVESFRKTLDKLVEAGVIFREEADRAFDSFKREGPLGEAYKNIEELQRQLEYAKEGLSDWQKEVKEFAAKGFPPELVQRFEGLKKRLAMQEAYRSIEEVQRRIENLRLGLEDWQVRLRDFMERPEVTEEMASEMGRLLKEEERLRRIREDSRRIIEDTKTEAERASEEASRIMEAYREGFIGGDVTERALTKLKEELKPKIEIEGFIGFEEWGRRLQESFLRQEDPQRLLVKQGERQVNILESIDNSLKEIKQKEGGLA